MDLGSRIKGEREKQNLSQDELALKLNISRQAVSKWETGKSYPDIETLLKLSDIFDLSLDELVKGDQAFQKNLILESKNRVTGLAILGYMLVALGGIVAVWGGASYTPGLMDSNYMSFLVGGLVLLFIGFNVISYTPIWLRLCALYVTGAAVIVYLVGFYMTFYVFLSGVTVTAGIVLWLTILILKKTDR
jgi:Predicted transcription factor, homolog of eukaryotic MBF1